MAAKFVLRGAQNIVLLLYFFSVIRSAVKNCPVSVGLSVTADIQVNTL